MNLFRHLAERIKTLVIDYSTQGAFLGGDILSIDDSKIYKTSNSSYQDLKIIFKDYYQIKPTDSIVDVGCGKARVFSYLLYHGYRNRMTGYEINTEVAAATAKRLKRYQNVSILADDIFSAFPTRANVFYMYHPFKEAMMMQFVEHILHLRHLSPVIIYNNPVFVSAFSPEHFDVQLHDIDAVYHHEHLRFAVIKSKHDEMDTNSALSQSQTWKFFRSTVDGKALYIEDLNIWDYKWHDTKQSVAVKDPIYNEDHVLEIYEITVGKKTITFAAGEFSNQVWGIYLKV